MRRDNEMLRELLLACVDGHTAARAFLSPHLAEHLSMLVDMALVELTDDGRELTELVRDLDGWAESIATIEQQVQGPAPLEILVALLRRRSGRTGPEYYDRNTRAASTSNDLATGTCRTCHGTGTDPDRPRALCPEGCAAVMRRLDALRPGRVVHTQTAQEAPGSDEWAEQVSNYLWATATTLELAREACPSDQARARIARIEQMVATELRLLGITEVIVPAWDEVGG